MNNSGEELEQLVKLVEDIFKPQGFEIEARKRIFDDDGNQMAELDVLVSGTLSTTHIEWLIECRDRPSEGPAPGSWIQQLIGRRITLGLNKVTAVSTTGFSPAAITFAQKGRIELRSVDRITRTEVESWFRQQFIPVHSVNGSLKHAAIRIDGSDEDLSAAQAELAAKGARAKIFFPTWGGEAVSIDTLWTQAINQALVEMNDGVIPNGPPVTKQLQIDYPNPEQRYKLSLNGTDVQITRITFIGDITISVTEAQITNITRYSSLQDGRAFAESITFDLPVRDESISLSIHRIPDQDGAKIAATARRVD